MRNKKKLSANRSLGLVDAVDKINSVFTEEDEEFVTGSSGKRRKNHGNLKFTKFETRSPKEE